MKRSVIITAVAATMFVASAMLITVSNRNKAKDNESNVTTDCETVIDSSSVDSSDTGIIFEVSSLKESSLKDSSVNSSKPDSSSSKPDDISSKICNSSNVQNESEIEQTETVYVEENANQTYFEPVENNAYVGEPVQDNKTYEVVETPKSVGDAPVSDYEPTDYEKILLSNLVGREYGSDWVSTYDKAKVVATVMNRVEADEFPDTIYDVVSQPGQFDGYLPSDSYTYQVTDDCIAAVDYYFDHPDEFGDYKYYYGTGYENIFY